MKLGVVSRIGEFPESEWEGEFATFGKNGENATHLELISNYPYLGPMDYEKRVGEILKSYSEREGIALTIHLLPNQRGMSKTLLRNMFSSEKATKEFLEKEKGLQEVFNIGSLNEDVRQQSREEVISSLRIAKDIGAKLITIHGGVYIDEKDFKKHLESSRKTIEELNPHFAKAGIKLCIENLPTIGHADNVIKEYPQKMEDWLYLIEGLNSVGACLDVGHANVSGNVFDYYETINATGKLWDMHLSDNLGDKDNHLPIQKGNINFRELFRRLKKDSYQGYCSVELDTWCRNKMEKGERIEALKYLREFI